MENPRYILKKVSCLFPSSLTSCHLHVLPDVAENSTIPKNTTKHLHNNNDLQKLTPKKLKIPKKTPTYPKPSDKSTLNKKNHQQFKSFGSTFSVNQSSSATSGWFSSSDEKTRQDDETGTFHSFSSNSGGSFRINTSQRFKKCEEMKSIDERGRCSFSSLNSLETILHLQRPKNPTKNVANKSKNPKSRKVFPEYELGLDHNFTRIYYSKNGDSEASLRRRCKRKTRAKQMSIGESYAVEKNSCDPCGDFRSSMVEMIVEKQMFRAEDLQRLLHCFLNLNSVSYHEIIIDVFSEICETLLSN